MKKRVLSLFMALALCLSMTPEVSYAEEAGVVTEQEAKSGESTADVYIAGSNDDSDSTDSDTTGGDSTDSDTTGGDSTGSNTTGGDSTDSDTTGGDSTSSDTTGSDIIGGNTTGNDVSGNDVSGGDAGDADADVQDAEKDAAVQAAQALIDALPENITAENAEAIGEQLAAIGEALAALTDEQLAKLDMTRFEAICVALTTFVAVQDDAHDHDKMKPWTKTDALPTDGKSYYLTTNVTLAETWTPANDTVLCLNGYSITMNADSTAVITIESDVTFTLYDCNDSKNGNGIITHGTKEDTSTKYTGKGVNMNGGTFNMYGGKIAENSYSTASYNGGGVCMAAGIFNMYGGTIRNNSMSGSGGGVYVGGGTFNMTGGEIKDNSVNNYGGGVYLGSGAIFRMTNGAIKSNVSKYEYGFNGGGVYAENGSSFIVSAGAEVSGNKNNADKDNNVELDDQNTIIIAGKLTGSIGVTPSTYNKPALKKHVTIAKAGEGYAKLSEDDFACITSDKTYYPFFEDGVVKLYATKPQVHPICGGEKCDQHDDVIWEGISNLNEIKESGNYYLIESVELNTTWTCSFDVNLCLNGKNITQKTTNNAVIKITESGNLTLTDCGTTYGKITHYDSSTAGGGVEVYGGSFTMYGGSIADNKAGRGVQVHGGSFTMYDGLITSNTAEGNGVGVYVGGTYLTNDPPKYSKATFEMYGGTISNNTAKAGKNSYYGDGGGVYVGTYTNTDGDKSFANFIMHDGTISGNYAYRNGGGVFATGTFTMQNGSISGNTATYNGSGVYIGNTFTMQGGSISGNNIITNGNYYGGVYITSAGTITVSGEAKITDNTVNGSTKSNLYWNGSDKIITIGTEGMKAGASIGVTTREKIKEGKTAVIAMREDGSKSTETERAAFVSDVDYTTELEGNNVVFANGKPHVHSICATPDCTHKGIHAEHDENQVWESIESTTELNEIKAGGHYYLAQDVTLDASWIFDVEGEVSLCLNGKTITGPTGKSAIIVESGTSLHITDCSTDETGNETGKITHATDAKGNGIGNYGTLILWKGNITGNTYTSYGGGVYTGADSKFTMHGGSITGNKSTDAGGGVYIDGTFTMDGGDITKNSGGGVVVGADDSTFEMTGGSIANNTGKGGVYLKYGSFEMNGGNIANNAGMGGVCIRYASTFTMNKGIITGNTCSDDGGGGVYVYREGTFEMKGGSITQNEGKGGGVYVGKNGEFKMTGGDITNNKISGMYNGVGVYLNGGKFTMDGGYITENVCTNSSGCSGGVFLNYGEFIMNDGTINNNSSKGGAGVRVGSTYDIAEGLKAKFTMNGGNITGNKNTDKSSFGGGVYVDKNGTFEMKSGNITQNESASDGGGVYVASGGTFTMPKESKGKIAENTSKRCGGGVYVYGEFTMSDGEITGNRSSSGGGGVYVYNTFKMDGGSIAGNTSSSSGGGVYVTSSSTFTMDGGSITGNKGSNYGGGVYVYNKSTFTMDGDSKITGNTSGHGGGGVFLNSSTFTMDGGSITGNKADSFAGGVDVTSSSTFTMNKGSITGNTSDCGGGVYVESKSTFTVSGAVKIKDNWMNGVLDDKGLLYVQGENGKKNNVCLATGTNNLATITINGLTKGAEIGVSKIDEALPTAGQPVKIATGASDSSLTYTNIFTPDAEPGYVVTRTGTDLYLEVHEHSWTYEPSGATITATCDAANCPNQDGGSVTIKAPAETDLIYDGKEKAATLEGEFTNDVSNPQISYTDEEGNSLGKAPTDAGSYTASIKVGDATASVTYEIAKATPKAGDFNFTPANNLTYDGNPKLAEVVAKNSGMGDVTAVKYYQGETEVEEPTDAGTYTVKIDVAAGDNYTEAEDLTDADKWEFTIGKNTDAPTVELSGDRTYTGEQIKPEVTVTVGGKTLTAGTDYDVTYGTNTDAGENAGSVKITAKGNYGFGDYVEKFDIQQAEQTLSFADAIVNKTYGDAAFKIESTHVTGNGAITYSSGDPAVATIDPQTGEVTILGAGETTIIATAAETTNYKSGTAKYTLKVAAAEIHIVGAEVDDKVYDGGSKANVTSVSFADENGELKLTQDDYTAVGKFLDVNAGENKDVEVSVNLTSKNYVLTGDKTCTTTATINKKAISIESATPVGRGYDKDNTSVTIDSVDFAGAVTPLVKGTDYTVTGKMADANAGNGKKVTVTVELQGDAKVNYGFVNADNTFTSITTTYTTVDISKAKAEITAASEQTIVKNGVAEDISKWVSFNNTDSDAKLTYTLVGTPRGIDLKGSMLTAANEDTTEKTFEIKVTAEATTNFDAPAEKTITVTVVDKIDAKVSITGAPASKTYGDEEFKLTATKTAPDGGKWSWSSSDPDVLEISGADTAMPTITVKKVGSAILTVTYTSDTHYGSDSVTIIVKPKDITAGMIGAIPDEVYTAKDIKPTPEVKDGEIPLTEGTDFDYSYTNNFNAGIATLTITGKGNYTGTASKEFTISQKSISGATIVLDVKSFAYTGSEQTVSIKSVTLSDGTVLGTGDYVIKDNSNKATDAGTVTLTIEGTGNYTGTATTTWEITKIYPELANFDVTPDLTTALNYNGTAKTVTAKAKTGIRGMGDVTVKYDGKEEAPTNAGSYAVTINVSEGKNYKATTIAAGTLIINKATTTLADIERGYKYTLTGEKTVELAGLVEDATHYELGTPTGNTGIISDYSVGADGVLKYTLTGTGEIGDNVTLPVTITSVNYEDVTVRVIITLQAKDNQADLTITSDNTVVYGKTLTLDTTGGSGKGDVTYSIVDDENSTGEATIEGNILTPKKAGTITVIATKAGDVDYNEAVSAAVVITITKATPTGEPDYTKITTGDKTLAEAGLTVGGLKPAEGTVEWIDADGNVLPDNTKVEVNTTYTWRFTPDDSNYESLTGEIELYHVDMPVISSQPTDASVKAGEHAVFEVTATGTDLTYQWQINRNDGRGFVDLDNDTATSASYRSERGTDRDCDGFEYRCIISNAAGSVTTETARLTVTVYYTVTATAGEHGSISPSGDVEVAEGSDQTFTITADDGYGIESLKVDGAAVETAASYTFTDVKETHTIEVTFKHLPYRIIDGADSSWTQNVNGDLVIRGNGAYADFLKVLVDGKEIASENYTATPGSTVITLKAEFLSTLSEGSHTFEIVWTNGSAGTHFTVARNSSGNNNNDNSNNNSSNDNAGSDNTEDKTVIAPKTGDASKDALMAVLVVVSFAGLAGMLVLKKRNAYK